MAKNQPKPEVKNAIAKAAGQADLMVVEGDQLPDYIKNETRGSENVGTEDIVIPRLELIQALSPQVKPGDPKYNADAKAGMLTNSVTGQLYGGEVMVVPVFFMKQWLVWRKRKWVDEKGREQTTDGGFFGSFNTEMDARDRMAEEIEKSGFDPRSVEIIDTPQHLCLLVNFNSGSVDEVMLSMPRTKAKISRQWNSMIRLAGGDRFSRVYRIASSMESKNGNDYYNFAIAQSGFPAKQLYERAEKLYAQIAEGQRHVVMDVNDYTDEDGPDSPTEM